MGGSGPHLKHGSLGSLESSTQMASRSVKPFLQAQYCDRLTDRPPPITTGRIYIRSTAMRPNNNKTNP